MESLEAVFNINDSKVDFGHWCGVLRCLNSTYTRNRDFCGLANMIPHDCSIRILLVTSLRYVELQSYLIPFPGSPEQI